MWIRFYQVSWIRKNQFILQNIHLTMEKDLYVLIGPNGSGKTTFLSLLTGILWPSQGEVKIFYNSQEYHTAHKKNIFGIFFPDLVTHFEAYHSKISVLETICTGFYQQSGYYTEAKKEQIQKAEQMIEKYLPSIGAKWKEKKFIHLSTGEKYRTLLLRSIINKPEVLVLDEPFNGLDIKGRIDFERIIENIAEEIPFIFIVLHRVEEIPSFIRKGILLKEGRIFRYGKIEDVLTSKNLSSLYGLSLKVKRISRRFYVYL